MAASDSHRTAGGTGPGNGRHGQRPATITDAAKQQMAGKRPTDIVRLSLILNDVHLWPQEEARLREIGCTFFVQTAFIATVDVPVERVEAVARLPTVKEIRAKGETA